MNGNDITYLSVTELGTRYRNGELSPVGVTEFCLARITAANPHINAFSTVLPDIALAAAQRARDELAAGMDRGPLHGIPVAVKDLFAVAGVRTGFGALPCFHEQPFRNATVVQRLAETGAVLVGTTEMLEFAYGTAHPEVGQTNNPWDLGRTAGGSSGGSAAATAAGLCWAAVGTDTGGSIRIPASYCGIVGMKPSHGMVSLVGALELSRSLDHAGPLARSVGDVRLMLEAMTGTRLPVPFSNLSVHGLRMGVLSAHLDHPAVTPAVRDAFARVCAALSAAGAIIEAVEIQGIEHVLEGLMLIMMPEASLVHEERYHRDPASFAEATRLQIEAGFLIPATAYARAQSYRYCLRRLCEDLYQRVDAVIVPTVPYVAPFEDPPVADGIASDEMLCIALHNLVGVPGLSLPCGMSPEGLPIGLHLSAGASEDARLLDIAAAVEAVLGQCVDRELASNKYGYFREPGR